MKKATYEDLIEYINCLNKVFCLDNEKSAYKFVCLVSNVGYQVFLAMNRKQGTEDMAITQDFQSAEHCISDLSTLLYNGDLMKAIWDLSVVIMSK